MKLAIFGSTGGTGRELVQAALAQGHEVAAFARTPSKLNLTHERLRVVQGNVSDAGAVAAALAGQDAALCCVGPAKGEPPGTVISTATKNILAGMKQQGVKRLVFESGLMVGDGRGMALPFRVFLAVYRAMNRALYEDKVIAEAAIRESGLEWVIVRPPGISHAPARGNFRIGPDLRQNNTKLISHADVAAGMLACATSDQWLKQTVDIAY
jgi:putative NADH-flavin reductase